MTKSGLRVKQGAASFYIVAVSTLILMIIAVSFTTVILSELTRTINDDLSQSAYDAALAGVEDAKLAFSNYQKCKQQGSSTPDTNCEAVLRYIEESDDCNMVANILGRTVDDSGVLVETTKTSGGGASAEMQEAYTCVKIKTNLTDYSSTLTESDTTRVVRVRLSNTKAKNIGSVKVSWYSMGDKSDFSAIKGKNKFNYSNIRIRSEKVFFPFGIGRNNSTSMENEPTSMAVPPMISVGLVQTGGDKFYLSDFEKVDTDKTNRGTVFLVPTGDEGIAKRNGEISDAEDNAGNYVGAYYDGKENKVSKEWVVKSNNRAVKNLPFVVYCPDIKGNSDVASEWACSTMIDLPEPIGGDRNDDTFMFVVSLPYGQPSTSFKLEFFCKDEKCGEYNSDGAVGEPGDGANMATLSGMQIEVDSTGRANNLYRRVMVRMESGDTYYPFPLYAIELLGKDEGSGLLQKPGEVTCEWGKSDDNDNRWSGLTPTGPEGFCKNT